MTPAEELAVLVAGLIADPAQRFEQFVMPDGRRFDVWVPASRET